MPPLFIHARVWIYEHAQCGSSAQVFRSITPLARAKNQRRRTPLGYYYRRSVYTQRARACVRVYMRSQCVNVSRCSVRA